MPLLALDGVRKVFPSPDGTDPLVVLDGVDLHVAHGEKVAVLGRSGSGKSTLLSIVGVLDAATSGRYLVDGTDVSRLGAGRKDRLRAGSFGFVFQRFCLMPHMTARENVETSLMHSGVPRAERRQRALCALAEVGLEARAQHRPGQLSGGEQQRVALARALAARPAVILADEPTGSLDETTGAQVARLMHDVAKTLGSALVVVTHDPVVVRNFDRTIVLERGRVVS